MRSLFVVPLSLFVLASAGVFAIEIPTIDILRGDANNDGRVNLADSIFIQAWLFQGGSAPMCMDAADVNDDGAVNMADPVYLNSFLFLGGSAPPRPYPGCGQDPTADLLPCNTSACP
jgi:hypothetical protein